MKTMAPAPATSPMANPTGSQRAIRRELSNPQLRGPAAPSQPRAREIQRPSPFLSRSRRSRFSPRSPDIGVLPPSVRT